MDRNNNIYKLDETIKAFEDACDCTVTLHDPQHFLYSGTESLVNPIRSSHRQTFPLMCGCEKRNYCIQHCLTELDAYIAEKRPRIYIKRCRQHYVEVVVPVYHNQNHVITFFAGIWIRPLPHKTIDQIAKLLPVVAVGVLNDALTMRSESSFPDSTKEKIESFLERNYQCPVSTANLAESLSLSVSRTCHLVKSCYGKPFSVLLTEKRIFHAKLFLRNTDYRINEIAGYCGFPNLEHFTRTFKLMTGRSPRIYRYDINKCDMKAKF